MSDYSEVRDSSSCSCESSSSNEDLINKKPQWTTYEPNELTGDILITDAKISKENTEEESTIEKKKHKKWKTICTAGCRYDVIHEVARMMELKEVPLDDQWIIHWTDSGVSFERIMEMKRFQKINHFPGMTEICRKDLLARNMNRMFKMFPLEYSIFPLTWCLPQDYADLHHYVGYKKRTMICKPDAGCQGKGIYLVRSIKEVAPTDRQVVQQYINKPFLIDGYKFDLRIYVLLTQVEPDFRIYVYKEGLARFATVLYEHPTSKNLSNMYMHLTNYAVNRHSSHFVEDDIAGSKRKLTAVTKWWEDHNYDTTEIWQKIDDAIVKTFISAAGILRHNYRSCFPNHAGVNACFEILGFDILLDHKLNPFVLEVNLSPSYHTDTNLDKEVKEGLIRNTLELLDWDSCNPKRCKEEERKKAQYRLFHANDKAYSGSQSVRSEDACECASSREMFELEHIGNFRRIYPIIGSKEKYDTFIEVGLTSQQETIASRAREEYAKLLREELHREKVPDYRIKQDPTKTPVLLCTNKSILNPPKNFIPKAKGILPPIATLTMCPKDQSKNLACTNSSLPNNYTLNGESEFDWPYDCDGNPYSYNGESWIPKMMKYAELNRTRSMKKRMQSIRPVALSHAVKKALSHYNVMKELPRVKSLRTLYESPYKASEQIKMNKSTGQKKMVWKPIPISNYYVNDQTDNQQQDLSLQGKAAFLTKYYWMAPANPASENMSNPIRLTRAHVVRTQSNAAKLRRLRTISDMGDTLNVN